MARTKQYRYFLYSREQQELRTKAEAAINKQYVPGKVISGGKWKNFTEISATPSNNKFADAKVVAEGNLEDMKYTNSTSEWRMR